MIRCQYIHRPLITYIPPTHIIGNNQYNIRTLGFITLHIACITPTEGE